MWGVAAIALAAVVLSVFYWRQLSKATTSRELNASIPFRPAVTYHGLNVSVRNTEQEPYVNTSMILYVGGTRYSAHVGTIRPGETVTHSLLTLTNEHGASFNPNSLQISDLEVRANFRGHEMHKDFPTPK